MNKTFEEWKEEGFSVMKGEKSIGRNKDGECLFGEEQVVEMDLFIGNDEAELYGFDPYW